MRIRKSAIIRNGQEIAVPKPRIYLDHAATTPIRPEALAAMQEGFAIWANPSSPHAEGRKAKIALEETRDRVKAALGWDGEVIFTSGASEAATMHIVAKTYDFSMSTVEHDAMLFAENMCDDLVEVDSDGSVNMQSLRDHVWAAHIRNNDGKLTEYTRKLIGIQHVNSETGNRQNIEAIAQEVHAGLGLLMVDCAQSTGKFSTPPMADLVVVSAHKFGGPIGVGALLVKDFAMLDPEGGQERGYRRGTENLPGILSMAAALEASGEPYLANGVAEADEALATAVRNAGGVWLADRLSDPTPFIRAIAMPSTSGKAQLMRLDMAGFAVSQGSACSSGTMKSSPVLAAMGVDAALAERTIRVSYGWNTTVQDVERFTEAWVSLAR